MDWSKLNQNFMATKHETLCVMEVRSGNVAKLVNRLSRDLSQLNKTTTAPSVDVSFRRSVSVLSGNSCLMHVHPPRET
ncbi:unnamed protein product [Brugia pahangi]|uniref:ACT domain-containing protein n=1 Tax=Brugia pahangi TaxID=6280 RepID=A0A0N4T3R8_BRUPA|nr:unnamed protein product [Brugia pahangi]